MKQIVWIFLLIAVVIPSGGVCAQQRAVDDYMPEVTNPAFEAGAGPVVMIDEAHHNFHTLEGRYRPFAQLLEADGFRVIANKEEFSAESLSSVEILVISNALAEENQEDWTLPTYSAFTDEEITALSEWVSSGGSLFLIVDHMPMPGCNDRLARAFGVQFSNGYAVDPEQSGGPMVFSIPDGSLKEHPITRGRSDDEQVEFVLSFTGSAFKTNQGYEPLMILGEGVVSALAREAGVIEPTTVQERVGGWYQGAVARIGAGRIAVFGEASMFTGQVAGDNFRFGFIAPEAEYNAQFLLNIAHWLAGILGEPETVLFAKTPSGHIESMYTEIKQL